MNRLRNIFTLTLVFLLPLFFLPTTQEYFITNKIYLLVLVGLLLLVISTIQLFVTKKIIWHRSPFDTGLSLILIAEILSIIIATPNKFEGLLNPYFGLMMFFGLVIFYFVLSQNSTQKNARQHLLFLHYAGLIVGVLTLIFLVNPFKNTALPVQFQFLKSANFSPLGNQLDLALFLGFLFVLQVGSLFSKKKTNRGFLIASLCVFASAFAIAVYHFLRPELPQQAFLLTPLRNSWFAAIEILKNPLSVIFGAGIGNFASIFTRVKDFAYNQSAFWQISSFNLSRSGLLHIFTETGILGLTTFGFLFFSLWRELTKMTKENHLRNALYFLSAYIFLALVFFPPSFITFFLLIFILFLVTAESHSSRETLKQEFDLKNLLPFFLGLEFILLIFILGFGYFLGRSYLAEYFFKQSLDGYQANNLIEVYNNQRQAVILNPYVERFHINFAQTNLLIANNIAKGGELNEQQKQTVLQAVQAAINEGKAAVILNQQKSTNWENLALVYRNILNVVQGADAWAISSYQRAIQLDPLNPVYRLNLGGVYYSLQRYNEAQVLFSQAVSLKSDWVNAHYNLAWASYQSKEYQKAASEMQNVLKLLDKQRSPEDYEKAERELEQFKSQLTEVGEATSEAQPSGLQLPAQQPQLSPKLELPESAPPKAR